MPEHIKEHGGEEHGGEEHSGEQILASAGNTSDAGRGKGGRWRAGHCPNANGRRGKPRPEEDDGLGTDEAARMRRVYMQPESQDCNATQRVLRKTLEANPVQYIKLLRDLETKQAAAPGPDVEAEADEGEEHVRALIAELLAEASGDLKPKV